MKICLRIRKNGRTRFPLGYSAVGTYRLSITRMFVLFRDVAPYHAEMVKAADGKNVWLVGGGDLVGQFHDHGLLDEIILSVAPVMLASGAPLLPRRITTPPMKLIDVQKHGDVFAILTYEVQRFGDKQQPEI